MVRFVGTKVEFGADTDELALNLDARELPLVHADPFLNTTREILQGGPRT